MKSSDVEQAIRKRWPRDAYAVLFQVANGTGYAKTRTADALVFGLWPSRGLDIEGVEVKVSRSDWRREIEKPEKAAAFAPFCHRWWIAAPPGVVETGELPSAWGLLEVNRGVLRQVVEAPRTENPKPLGASRTAAIMRNLQTIQVARRDLELKNLVESATNQYKATADQAFGYIKAFEAETGIDISRSWGGHRDRVVAALKMVEDTEHILKAEQNLRYLRSILAGALDAIDTAIADNS